MWTVSKSAMAKAKASMRKVAASLALALSTFGCTSRRKRRKLSSIACTKMRYCAATQKDEKQMSYTLERHESYRGRTTPEISWRVWNSNHTSYTNFQTKREAKEYLEVMEKIENA
jgi:hypothetical protein